MKTLEEIKKEFEEKMRNYTYEGGFWLYSGMDGDIDNEKLWNFIESTISQTKQELIEEAKKEIYKNYKDESVASGHHIWNEALDLTLANLEKLSNK